MKITPQEIANWRQDPTTAKVFEYFRKLREKYKEDLAEGAYTFPDAGASAQRTANIIGFCEAYKDILDISYEDFEEVYDLTQKEEENGGAE